MSDIVHLRAFRSDEQPCGTACGNGGLATHVVQDITCAECRAVAEALLRKHGSRR